MDRSTQLLALDLIPGIGCYRLRKKLSGCSPFELFDFSNQQLAKMGFSVVQIQAIKTPNLAKITQAEQWLAQVNNRHLVSYFDPKYPDLLKEISSPPLLLFCQGDVALLKRPQIAVVGSRTPTISAKEIAKRLAKQLVEHNLVVTSGLATGIDSCAHVGAIVGNGQTIAVLGSGLNVIYPRSNIELARKIIETGLLVSEFWPDVPPIAHNFPRRNRIVSGLSLGIVVVEAAQRSGSLITARLAAEQNREVFAVPGSINNPKVQGCHKLINQGAKLITDVADIIDELPQNIFSGVTLQHEISSRLSPKSRLPFDLTLESVGFELTSIDQIVELSHLPIAVVLEQLLSLELAGLIIFGSGGYFRVKGGTDV